MKAELCGAVCADNAKIFKAGTPRRENCENIRNPVRRKNYAAV